MNKKIHQDFEFDADLIKKYQIYAKHSHNKNTSKKEANEHLNTLADLFLIFAQNRSHDNIK